MKKQEGGFTLVEIIVVIAIIGILSSIVGIGIPAYQRFSDRAKLKAETRTILQSFLKARQDAVIDGHERMIYINAGTGRIYIKKLYDPADPPADVLNIPQGITIVNNTYSSGLGLKPIGTVSKGGHLSLRSPGGEYMTIVVQVGSGRIYMKEGLIDD